MRKTKLAGRLPLVAVVLAALSAPAMAEPAMAELGLPDAAAVAAVLDANPSVMAAAARVDAARSEARALSRGTHEFNLSGIYTRRDVDGEGRFDEYDATLTRPFRLPGKARLDRDIGAYGVEAATNRAEDARHQAALLLAQSWWDWLGAAEEARLDGQAVANYERMFAAVQRRVTLRDAAVLEADQARAALAMARLGAEQSAGRERVARARLAARFPTLALPDTVPSVPVPQLSADGAGGGPMDQSVDQSRDRIAAYGEKIVARSHEIAAAEAEQHKLAARAERVRQDRIADPSLGVRVFSERNGMEKGAGVVMSMPLGGGHRRALADQAEAEASAARAETVAARQAVQEMASADMAEARYLIESWSRAREGLSAQMAALEKLRRAQAVGEIGLADVLLGERQVHDAFRAEAIARTQAMMALTRLRIDSHELWIAD